MPVPFEHAHRVRFSEVDPQRIVFNSRYLEFFDAAMVEWMRSLGWSWPQLEAAGCDLALVSIDVRYRASARFDDELGVGVEFVRLGDSSLTLRYAIRRDDDVLVSADAVYVNVGTGGGKRSIPPPVRDAIDSSPR